MTTADTTPSLESHTFEADVAKLLHLMVHSVYSDKDVFLRELVSNAADACEKLRYEAISHPALLDDDPKARITLLIDPDNRRLTVEDNGIGLSRDEMIEALGTIARSGTKAFMERIQAAQGGEGAQLIGQFGVGFYSAFMVADRVEVVSRRAGSEEATIWSSDGKGSYTVAPIALDEAPARGTRVILHLMEEARSYTERYRLERIVKEQSGHVPVPIAIVEKPGAEPQEVADGAALWVKPRSEIKPEEYTDFYRSVAGQFDEPALTVHFRAEGRHEYTALAFVPGSTPFDLFDPERHGRMKLYVKRVFITDEADILPRYLRFVRGLVDSADLPLNVSREMIQESPLLAAIKKGVTSRILSELEKLAQNEPQAYTKVWETFGPVLKEGLYEDFERRQALLGLARFKTTASGDGWRSLKDYVSAFKENQTAIYYVTGMDLARLKASPQLEGFRARGIEVLLLPDPVDSFWVTAGVDYEGKPFKSVTQGAADLAPIPLTETQENAGAPTPEAVTQFIQSVKATLGEAVADVRASERLTESAVCLVASETGMDRQLERLLARAGQLTSAAKPILEINPRHELVVALGNLGEDQQALREDAAHLLLDEARILDGELPADTKAFSQRLARVMRRCVP
ncbi:molecular chaperone HtpG [Microvirga guangxiensis]|uniref:Chaperone protein HtpG n=1 Tax=Microvirga guangxiensis TaxID=549386 RepID=A0A1G5L0A5_9HYPH|nr:molecular chaperone HtpG [Microvirga guangxiensis]SCZ06024.1 molecular chaperone HtpG [Microvirga guangxiensis]